jgi:hypothetical protein
LNKNHSSWKGDKYNVKVEWENGEVSYEPLDMIAADNPDTCAIYGNILVSLSSIWDVISFLIMKVSHVLQVAST